jgi:pimeloyl-ACP methyl ester carboxylesterase
MINRRTFGKAIGVGAAAAATAGTVTAAAPSAFAATPAGASPTATGAALPAFGPVKQINAGVLNIGYVELGPADGPAVILLHGWPYDIHSYVEVAPLLARAGYRVVVPHLRGHGTTSFLSSSTPRNAQQSAFALDIIALMDALGIDKAVLGGYDWGSRTVDIIAALWPERVKALVSVSGYVITNLVANLSPLPPKSEWDWWYQYYFATERGELGLTENTAALAQQIWKFNSPNWKFSQDTFDATAASFTNPDYVPIVIFNYRWRLSLVPSDPHYAGIEAELAKTPTIGVPTITIDGEYDPFAPPGDGSTYRAHFTGKYQHRTLKVGHNVPQEAPREFARAVMDADRL